MLYLIRHGATDNNLLQPPRLQGRRLDAPLSVIGRRQAEATAAFLAAVPLAAVYCSPLLRARQTAEAIAARHGLDPREVPELSECDVGRWEGRTWPEIEREEPEAYHRFQADAYTHGYGGGENLRQVAERVTPALQRLLAENAPRPFAVVAHNVVNRVYLGQLLEVPPARLRGVPQENCGINVLRTHGGQAKVLTINSVFHLSEQLP